MKKQSLQDSDSAAERPADHDNSRVIRAFGQEAYVLVSSEQTGDAFCVLRFFIPPGNVTPPHLHHATDETFLIESGEVEINRGGELLRGRRGDVIYLPKGIPHALRVIGNDEGVALVVCVVPGSGFDRFFAACAEEFKKGEPEMPLLVKLAAEYGIEFQSNPPSESNRVPCNWNIAPSQDVLVIRFNPKTAVRLLTDH